MATKKDSTFKNSILGTKGNVIENISKDKVSIYIAKVIYEKLNENKEP